MVYAACPAHSFDGNVNFLMDRRQIDGTRSLASTAGNAASHS